MSNEPWGWQPVRPRPRQNPWVVAIVIISIVAVVGMVAVFFLFIRTMGEAHDHFQFDDAAVRNRATAVCAALFVATDELAGSVIADPSDRVTAENEALLDLVSDFEQLGAKAMKEDKPALTWRDDWLQLATARAEYATALRSNPHARRPTMPLTRDGYPISRRMSSLHPGCSVPLAILDDFEITPFRDLEECTYAMSIEVCATPDGAVFIDGLPPRSDAEVWIRFGGAVSQSTRTADSVGRIELTGVRLGGGTVVIVDAIVAGFRDVVMAA